MYLAKSNPKESIQVHTDNLLKNYEVLMDIYGNKFENSIRQALRDACLYHDLGKVNQLFQNKLKGIKNTTDKEEIPHGYLSIGFIKYKKLKEKYEVNLVRNIVTAVAKHHHRDFNFIENEDYIKEEIKKLKEEAKNFKYKELPDVCNDINTYVINSVYPDELANISEEKGKIDYIILKGLLNRIDYAASGYYKIEYRNDFLLEALELYKKSWGENADYNDLQKFMLDNQDRNVIAIAETGYGKTEAGLLWIGDNKGFFTLPLRSAINPIFDRIRKDILKEEMLDERLSLLHSDSLNELFERAETDKEKENLDLEDLEILRYDYRSRQKSLPLTISTIDQIFKFVYKYIGFEQELATLSYSKVVIDEIQMYSPDLLAYLIIGLDMITKVGGRFSIITATLPPFILDLLKERKLEFIMPKNPYYNGNRIRHCMELKREEIKSEFIRDKYRDNKVLVIVNTVKKAQKIYDELIEEIPGEQINVFHGGFIKRDRKAIGEQIISFGHKDNEKTGIWICTQVAEASLDIDFDILITELSDMNGLFQRMGRCYRNRELEEEKTNIYVFDGGLDNTSGIGFVNDEDIFNLSKKVLRQEFNDKNYQKISEKDKINIINTVYTTENISETKYLKEVYNIINYVESTFLYELNRNEVIKRFRAINNIDIIPIEIYEDNIDLINNCIEVLNETNSDKNKEEKKQLRVEKTKARIAISDLTVSIPFYFSNYNNTESKRINDYEHVNVYTCEYDKKFGIKHIKDEVKGEFKEYTDNII